MRRAKERRQKPARSDFAAPAARARSTLDAASLSGAIGWQRASGIDSFGVGGDRDGYRNLSGARARDLCSQPGGEGWRSALALTGRSEFDGYQIRRSITRTRSTAAATASPQGGAGPSSGRRIRRGAGESSARCSARRTATFSPTIRSTVPAERGERSMCRLSGSSLPAGLSTD